MYQYIFFLFNVYRMIEKNTKKHHHLRILELMLVKCRRFPESAKKTFHSIIMYESFLRNKDTIQYNIQSFAFAFVTKS